MAKFPLIARGLWAAAVAVVVMSSSYSAGAAVSAEASSTEELVLPQALTLPAPFTCGTEWQGSTYSGHGSHNWNLDLNRAGDVVGSDLGLSLLSQANGTVAWFKQTGYNNRAGTYIEIDYGDVSVRYLHLISGSIPEELAEIGAPVDAAQLIGRLGATGRVSGPHLHLEYWDSAGYDNAPWYQLPAENHIPVAFDGQEMVATPGGPTATAVSTNCPAPSVDDKLDEILEQLDVLGHQVGVSRLMGGCPSRAWCRRVWL
jgi:murein DD-endopeptidase MepM/ murein hydrolase activator NlpD